MTLYHYTCDHAVQGIIADGHILPLSNQFPSATVPPWSNFAWFTDMAEPDRPALGLTSRLLSCDRTAHRFTVTDVTEVERWINVRRHHPWAADLESEPGAMPAHWWIATEPVPVFEEDR